VTIREWVRSDNTQISELEKICFAFPWSADMVDETASGDNFYGFVAEVDEKIVGYAGAVFALDVADIALVAVAPSYLRRGYAFKLMGKLCSSLNEKGVRYIYLEVRAGNIPAKKLYEKCGFIPVGIRKNYYEDTEDAIVMMKSFVN